MKYLVLFSFLLIPFYCGCARYSIDQYEIEVLDEEDNTPVKGAKVYSYYVYAIPINSPKPDEAFTDKNGIADMEIASYFPRMLRVTAEDYKTAVFLFDKNRVRKNEFIVKFKDNHRARVLIYKEAAAN